MADVEILIIGGGFSGLCMAITLLKAGHDSFMLVEKHADLGGTWLLNRYPGCCCDVPSHLYSLSFDRNPAWTSMYADHSEIHRYMKDCALRHGVLPHVRFNSTALSAIWDDAAALWQVEVERKEAVSDSSTLHDVAVVSTISARFVVRAVGSLHVPKYPVIKGIEKFTGPAFHSSVWDSSIDLEGKRVAVIGTGASSIQIVPEIAPVVKKLYVFQRNPPYIFPKLNLSVPKRCRQLFALFPLLMCLFSWLLFLMHEMLVWGFLNAKGMRRVQKWVATRHMQATIKDPDMRERVTPRYEIGCKRILLSNTFYLALIRPNVELITHPIQKIHKTGFLVSTGDEQMLSSIDVDIIVYATGFDLTTSKALRVVGISTTEFSQAGYSSLLGTTKQGFPNFFTLSGFNTGVGHTSQLLMIEAQVRYSMSCLELMRGPSRTIEPHGDSQCRYQDLLACRFPKTVWNSGGCMSWYLDRDTGHNFSLWPGSTLEFIYRSWSAKPSDYHII